MILERKEGWEMRLLAVIESARNKPYALGEHDCLRLACAAVEALTSVDLWAEWRGRYSTKREALLLIAEYSQLTENRTPAACFTAAASRLFRCEPSSINFGRRGDVVEYVEVDGQPHLGVVNGATVAVLHERGLIFVPTGICRHAWRIG